MNLLLDNQPSESELLELLNRLIQNWETEVAEFKEAGKDYDRNKIGQYFSAISNEAIEEKSPNIFLSASVSETIGEQSQYVKNKAFNDLYYKNLIVKYLEQYGSAKKRDVRELLWDKLPEVMDDKQKESKVKNLLAQMRRTGIITTDSANQQRSSWILVKDLNK